MLLLSIPSACVSSDMPDEVFADHRNVRVRHELANICCRPDADESLVEWPKKLQGDFANLTFRHRRRRKIFALTFSNPFSANEFVPPIPQNPLVALTFGFRLLTSSTRHLLEFSSRRRVVLRIGSQVNTGDTR